MARAKVFTLLLPASLVLLAVPLAWAAPASAKVLKLPFTDSSVQVVQGWRYNFGSSKHEGIDYKRGDWLPFDVVAAYGGELNCVPDGTPGYTGYGNTCTVKHVVGSLTFYTLYAHLAWYEKTGGQVQTGEKLGVAGKTGGDDYPVHLHFEIQVDMLCKATFCRRDPYDIGSMAEYYPGGASYQGMGENHWWADNPPVTP